MSGVRFDLTLADGRTLRGVRIHGRGGELGCRWAGTAFEHRESPVRGMLKRLRAIIKIANAGRQLPIFEPSPGCVRCYFGPWCSDLADEKIEDVSIRGASVELHARPRGGARADSRRDDGRTKPARGDGRR